MSTPILSHLIYTSAAVGSFHAPELKAMLQAWRVANARRKVSGMLLYTAGTFFQVIEGDDSVLETLFEAIAADPRHRDVTRIISEPIAQRSFSEWTMGFVEVDDAEHEAIPGLSDFFNTGKSLSSLPAGRARNILTAFGQGRWRVRLGANA